MKFPLTELSWTPSPWLRLMLKILSELNVRLLAGAKPKVSGNGPRSVLVFFLSNRKSIVQMNELDILNKINHA